MSKTIFITGVAGFLGSHLADRCLARGWQVKGCDNLLGGYADNIPTGVDFTNADCADFETMNRLMQSVDTVVHCAAVAPEGFSVFAPNFVTKNNFQTSVSCISAAVANKVRRFVYCSSMSRYGYQEVLPYTEDMVCNPQNPYGIAKHSTEKILQNIADTHGMEYVIAVPHNIIGPRQKYDDPYRNVASIMINLMLQGRQPIIYGDGEQKRCFAYVDGDVGLLEKMIDAPNVVGEVINIGPDEEFITINELAALIGDILTVKVEPVYVTDRPQEVKLAYCSSAKARKLLGYETKISLRDGLQTMANWIAMRGPKPFTYHYNLEIINDKTPTTWKDKLF